MSLYLVSYELAHAKEFGEYEYFHNELRKSHAQRVLHNVTALRSSLDAETIRDALVKYVHSNDRILVAEISEDNWAGWKLLRTIGEI